MENMKNSNILSLSTNKNHFGNNGHSAKLTTEKFNPMTSRNLLNQISFQSLVNKKSGTPKNVAKINFSSNLMHTNNIIESGRVYKNNNLIKNEDLFKKQNMKSFNSKDGIVSYDSINFIYKYIIL